MEQRLSQLRKALEDVYIHWRDDKVRLSRTSGTASPKAKDLVNILKGPDGDWGRGPIEACATMMLLNMDVVVDHLLSLGRLWKLPLSYYGPRALLRCTLESAAHVCWLADPEIDTRTRITRHFARQLHSSAQKVRYLNRNDDFCPFVDSWRSVHEAEASAARSLGLKVQKSKDNLFRIRDDMPSISDIIDSLIPELGFIYGGLSEFIHGDASLLRDRRDNPIIASIETIEQNSFFGVQAYTVACKCVASYCGSNSARRLKCFAEILDRVKPGYLSDAFEGPYMFTRSPLGSMIHEN
jgi:hypothetical protein